MFCIYNGPSGFFLFRLFIISKIASLSSIDLGDSCLGAGFCILFNDDGVLEESFLVLKCEVDPWVDIESAEISIDGIFLGFSCCDTILGISGTLGTSCFGSDCVSCDNGNAFCVPPILFLLSIAFFIISRDCFNSSISVSSVFTFNSISIFNSYTFIYFCLLK